MTQSTQVERRRNVLTPADMNELKTEIRLLFDEHKCQFQAAEVQCIKDFVLIYKETRSTVLKLVIGLLFSAILVFIVLGLQHNLISVGDKIPGK